MSDYGILKYKNSQGNWEGLPVLRGDKGDPGVSGIYVGTEPPEDTSRLWVDPNDQGHMGNMPAYSITDEGKYLMIKNGQPAWVSLINRSEVGA